MARVRHLPLLGVKARLLVCLPLFVLFLLAWLPPSASTAFSFTASPKFQKRDGIIVTTVSDDAASTVAASTYEIVAANSAAGFDRRFVFSKPAGALVGRTERFQVKEKAASSLQLVYSGTIAGVPTVQSVAQTEVAGRVTVEAPAAKGFDPGATVDVEVAGTHGQVIRLSYGVFGQEVSVDNVLPIIAAVAPPDRVARQPGIFILTAEVTDADSGFTGEVEKLNTLNQGSIVLTFGAAVIPKSDVSWTKIAGGWHVEAPLTLGSRGAEVSVPWRIEAIDAAGNRTTTDNTILVDGKGPTMASATTGHWWDPAAGAGTGADGRLKTGHLAKRTSVRLVFSDLSGLDPATVAPGDFSVDGATPVAVLVLDVVEDSKPAPDASLRRLLDVFLTLPSDLVSDARPSVRIVGQVADRAGNSGVFGETLQAADGLPPRLTVELGAIIRTDVEIFIQSDERLNGAPTVKLSAQTTATGGLGTETSVAASQTATAANRYRAVSQVGAAPAANAARRINVEVSALDVNNIEGRVGESNATLSGAITFELDPLLNNGLDPEFVVAGVPLLPGGIVAGGSLAVIEAVDPITVLVDFSRQCTPGPPATCLNGGEAKEYEGDTHKTVQLTYTAATVTLAGGARRSLPVTVAASDGIRFILTIPGSDLGDYQVVVQAKDEAGNVSKSPTSSVPDPLENRFTLVAAEPFEIPLAPGWNLISLPFTPANPAINSVIPKGHLISLVMGFDKATKAWQVSQRDSSTGLFAGDVRVMTSTTGYFVLTNAFQPLLVSRPTVSGASVPPPPPAIEVLQGWNLIPVLSRAAPLPREVDADDYLRLVTWEKAIGYSPLTRTWESVERGKDLKVLMLGDPPYTTPCGVTHAAPAVVSKTIKGKVCLGKAYWLWASGSGTIVP